MDLKLARTEYNMDCIGNTIKAILSYQGGKATINLFINGEMVYYYIIEDIQELSLDDATLIHLVSAKLVEDKRRWIKDCSLLEDHLDKLKLIDKVSVYKALVNGFEFILKLTTIDNKGEYYIFKLEYTNNKNNDILNCYVEAKDYEELLQKSLIYAETITTISNTFVKNRGVLMNNAFSKYFRR